MIKTQAAKTKTSQLYFQGAAEDSVDEVVVSAWMPAHQVVRDFGIKGEVVPGTIAQDFGFCALRVTTLLTVEFVTTFKNLSKTIDAVRGYYQSVHAIGKLHAANPVFNLDLHGSQEWSRERSLARIAEKTNCRRVNGNGKWAL